MIFYIQYWILSYSILLQKRNCMILKILNTFVFYICTKCCNLNSWNASSVLQPDGVGRVLSVMYTYNQGMSCKNPQWGTSFPPGSITLHENLNGSKDVGFLALLIGAHTVNEQSHKTMWDIIFWWLAILTSFEQAFSEMLPLKISEEGHWCISKWCWIIMGALITTSPAQGQVAPEDKS